MKITKNDYPWTIIIEDKIGKTSGKMYQSISLGFTSVKNREAQDPKDKYETNWINFFNEEDLLKLSSSAENAYQRLKGQREKEKQERKQASVQKSSAAYDNLNDDIPF